MIRKSIDKLIQGYMESQFTNKGRDIGYYKARQELLSNGTVTFFEPCTCIIKAVRHKGCISVPCNPIVADAQGRFSAIEGDGLYDITVRDNLDFGIAVCNGVDLSNDWGE